MIDQTWQPNALRVDDDIVLMPAGWAQPLAPAPKSLFSAQKSTDGKMLVLRYVNFRQPPPNGSQPQLAPATSLTVRLLGSMAATKFNSTIMWTLASPNGDLANTPGQPNRVRPEKKAISMLRDGTVLDIPANSYVIVVADGASHS